MTAAVPDPFIAWLLDQLQPLAAQIGEIRARRLFGGAGLYHDDIVFALVIKGVCYLRVDDATRARFADEGAQPFQYARKQTDRVISVTTYFSVPADALDGGPPLIEWTRLGIEAARRQANAKAAKPKGAPVKKKAPAKTTPAKKAAARKAPAKC